MADPVENNKPEANENGFKDRPRPFRMFRHEAHKTNQVLDQSARERAGVDTKLDALHQSYAPALEAHGLALKQAGDKRISVRKQAVDNLSAEVGATQKAIEELQKKMAEEQAKLARSQGALDTAAREMDAEKRQVVKENKVSYKAKQGELLKGISEARQERRAVYKKTRKQIRRERWNTMKRTTKEAVAFIPDLTIRFAKAAKRGAGEIVHVFHRSAKSAGKGFSEPTAFSIQRDKPLVVKPVPPKPQG